MRAYFSLRMGVASPAQGTEALPGEGGRRRANDEEHSHEPAILESRRTAGLYGAPVTRDSPVSLPLPPVGRPVRDNAGINLSPEETSSLSRLKSNQGQAGKKRLDAETFVAIARLRASQPGLSPTLQRRRRHRIPAPSRDRTSLAVSAPDHPIPPRACSNESLTRPRTPFWSASGVRGFLHVRASRKEEWMSSRPYRERDRGWLLRYARLAAIASLLCSTVMVAAKSWPL